MSLNPESQTAITEVLLQIAILQCIPKNRWITTTEILARLAKDGISILPRRIQRHLAALAACSAFHDL